MNARSRIHLTLGHCTNLRQFLAARYYGIKNIELDMKILQGHKTEQYHKENKSHKMQKIKSIAETCTRLNYF